MDAKEELKNLSILRSHVDQLMKQRQALYENMTSLRSSAGCLAVDKVQTSHSNDRIINDLLKIEEVETKLNERMLAWLEEHNRIFWKIESMQTEQYKDFLYYRYLRFSSYKEIAGIMDVCLRSVYRLHREALKEYAEL